jgi:hypothetical protein
LGPWKKAAPTSTAIYEHQLDRPISPNPDPKTPSSPSQPHRTKTPTDRLFDQYFEEKSSTTTEAPRPAVSLASTSSPFNKRKNSTSRRKSNSLTSLLTKSSTKSHAPKATTASPKTKQKTNSAEPPVPKTQPVRNTPPAMAPPSSTSQHVAPQPSPAAPKQKQEEITEEEMIAWLEMDDKNKQETPAAPQEQHDIQEILLSFPSHLTSPQKSQPSTDGATDTNRANQNEADPAMQLTKAENDFQLQIQQLEREYAQKNKSSANTSRRDLMESSSDSSLTEDGYVRYQVNTIGM